MVGRWATAVGTNGVRPLASKRRSQETKPAAKEWGQPEQAQLHAGQPSADPSLSGTSKQSRAAPRRAVPTGSAPVRTSARVAGTLRRATYRPTMPTGTFTRNMPRQLLPAMSSATTAPPTTWPAAEARLAELLVDWEQVARTCVARYRARMATHASERAWRGLVKRLAAASEDFTRIWGEHEVTGTDTTLKRFAHAELGLLSYHATVYSCTERVGNRFIAYTPADEVTTRRTEDLINLVPRTLACSPAA